MTANPRFDLAGRTVIVTGGGKGILSFKDDDQRFVFQGVHMILDGDHQRPWQPGEKRESRIIFIGRKLPEDKIREGFAGCVA